MKRKLFILPILFLSLMVFGTNLNAQTCAEPTALDTTTLTSTSAEITWTAGGTESAWNISWGTPGYTPGDTNETGVATAATNTYEITLLSINTEYEVYVQAECGVGNESVWEGPLNFTTECVASTGTDVQTACGSFTWIDGVDYTASNNSATHTIVGGSSNGCDSIVTLDLTFTLTVSGTDVQTACGSYTWIDGNVYLTDNNVATHTLAGASVGGCDSIVTLNLTFTTSVSGTDTIIACESFTWIDLIEYTASNTTATHTIVGGSVHGCDSIVTLNLTINNAVNGTDTQVACDSLVWLDGITYTSNNTSATHTLIGAASNGCDSIVTLNLTINNSLNVTDTQVACYSYTWLDGVTYTADNNTATFTIPGAAAHGCDSILTLDLTINASTMAGNDNSITVCKNQPIDLDSLLSSGATAGGTWKSPTNLPIASTKVKASSVASTYSYTYEVLTGICPSVATITIIVAQNCDYLAVNSEELMDVSVYPNPTSNILNIVNPSNSSSLNVEMLDMNGRVVLVENKALNNATEATLAIDHLEKGIYTLRVYNTEGQRTFKVVKQ